VVYRFKLNLFPVMCDVRACYKCIYMYILLSLNSVATIIYVIYTLRCVDGLQWCAVNIHDIW